MNAVCVGDVESSRGPASIGGSARIRGVPMFTAIIAEQRPPEVGTQYPIGILVGNRHIQWVLSPIGAETLCQPRILHVSCGRDGFFPDQPPGFAAIAGASHPMPGLTFEPKVAIGNIGCFRMQPARRNCAKLCVCTGQWRIVPTHTCIHRDCNACFAYGIDRPRTRLSAAGGGSKRCKRYGCAMEVATPALQYVLPADQQQRCSRRRTDLYLLHGLGKIAAKLPVRTPIRGVNKCCLFAAGCPDQMIGVGRIDRQCGQWARKISCSDDCLVAVIRSHRDCLDVRREWRYEFPTLAAIAAAPKILILGINHLWPGRIENKKAHHAAQVEHPPGSSCVMRNVGAAHVRSHEDGRRIVGADQRMKHRAAPSRSDHCKSTRTLRPRSGCNQQDESQQPGCLTHAPLSFAFDLNVSLLCTLQTLMSTKAGAPVAALRCQSAL